MTTMTLGKWGNARGVRIPLPFCEQLNLNIGDSVNMYIDENDRIIIEASKDQYTLQGRMNKWDGKRYESEELDWGESQGDEVW